MKELKLVLVKVGSFIMGSTKKDIKQLKKNFPDFESKLLYCGYKEVCRAPIK